MKFWLRTGLSIALVVLLFAYVVDAREVIRILQRFDATYLLLAIVVVTLDRVLMTFKWTLLLRAQGYRLPLFQGVTISCRCSRFVHLAQLDEVRTPHSPKELPIN